MTTLANCLQFNTFDRNLETISKLIDSAEPKVSLISGKRSISVEGFPGSVKVAYIAKRIMIYTGYINRLQSLPSSNITLPSPNEAAAGIKIANKVHEFYQLTDKKIKESPFLIKILRICFQAIACTMRSLTSSFFEQKESDQSIQERFEKLHGQQFFKKIFDISPEDLTKKRNLYQSLMNCSSPEERLKASTAKDLKYNLRYAEFLAKPL